MKKEHYEDFLAAYVKNQLTDLNHLQTIKIPQFQKLIISCNQIDAQKDTWIEALKLNEIEDKGVIYYIKILSGGTASDIQNVVRSYKSKYKKTNKARYRALPKVNNNHTDILYVGKTNSNFISRFRHHLGLAESNTYALQLKFWASDMNLELELWYALIDLEKEDLRFLEQIENVLHFNMKPILGRSGH